MKTKALVIVDDPVFDLWLQDAKGISLETVMIAPGDAAELRARVDAQANYDIVFCEVNGGNTRQRTAFIAQFHERCRQIPVVGLGVEENAECTLASMRAGARAFFVRHRDDATLGPQIERLLVRSTAAAPAASVQKVGQLFLAVSGHPHESIAFFAEHLALALVNLLPAGQRVLLVDLATPSGAAAIFLNLNQTYSALDAINDAHRCDQTLIDTAFTRHASGLYVLSLPEDLLGRIDFDVEQLLKLLTVLRRFFAYTVVAMDGHAPLAALAGIVDRADRTLLLSDQSILKSRHNKYLLRALRQQDCSLDRMALVVDNYRRRLGLEPRNLAELFELPLVAALQTESYNRIVSMNSGEPLFTLAHKDPFCAGMRKLAETLFSGELEPAPAPPGFFERLLG